ncbi:MAG: hypothetical protein WAT92_18830 [Saprospiraceae bacterium]
MISSYEEINNAILSLKIEKEYKNIMLNFYSFPQNKTNLYVKLEEWLQSIGITIEIYPVEISKFKGYKSYLIVSEDNVVDWSPGSFPVIEDYTNFKTLGKVYKISYEYTLNKLEETYSGWNSM